MELIYEVIFQAYKFANEMHADDNDVDFDRWLSS